MFKRENIKLPGVILFIWALISFVLGIILHYKFFGEIENSKDVLHMGILMSIFWIPVELFLHPAWQKENEILLFNKLEKLIKKGKHEKALKLIEKRKIYFKNIRGFTPYYYW